MSEAARTPKRFYAGVDVAETAEGWAVRLDGRPVRTPAGSELAVPDSELAGEIAREWEAQGEQIEPASMPLTRLVNSALDGVRGREEEIAADIAAYAATDLLCYRAGSPEGLAAEQAAHWDPVLAWFEQEMAARFVPVEGVMPRDQPAESLRQVREELDRYGAFCLAALHSITTLTGSALLALAQAHGAVTADQVWTAAHVDEDWQIAYWGEDAEAMARREARRRDFDAAARVLAHLAG